MKNYIFNLLNRAKNQIDLIAIIVVVVSFVEVIIFWSMANEAIKHAYDDVNGMAREYCSEKIYEQYHKKGGIDFVLNPDEIIDGKAVGGELIELRRVNIEFDNQLNQEEDGS